MSPSLTQALIKLTVYTVNTPFSDTFFMLIYVINLSNKQYKR